MKTNENNEQIPDICSFINRDYNLQDQFFRRATHEGHRWGWIALEQDAVVSSNSPILNESKNYRPSRHGKSLPALAASRETQVDWASPGNAASPGRDLNGLGM